MLSALGQISSIKRHNTTVVPTTSSGDEELRRLQAAALSQPGVDALMRVYGQYEAALAQADFYLSIGQPQLPSTLSNATS